jgi:hypothetical protein
MTWADFYLVCFLVGFLLSLCSLLLGSLHLNFHLSHAGGHGFHFHFGGGSGHGPAAGHAPAAGHGVHAGGHAVHGLGQDAEAPVSAVNFGTIAAFLAWFGGTGYLLEHYYGVWFVVALGVATLSGLGGASAVFWFLAKVLMKHEAALDPADYDMVGVLGKLSMPIRAGGIGELVYPQGGTRRVSGARAESGAAIAKGTEVVVTR